MRTRRQQQQRDEQAANATTAPVATADTSSSDNESNTPTTQPQQHQQQHNEQLRAAWDDETLVCLLQLRYVEMDAHFRCECVTSAELIDAWHVLANELNLRMDVAFSSLQCRARVRT